MTSKICVILITPPPYHSSGIHASLAGSENLGLGYLAASLENEGFAAEILNIEDQTPFEIATHVMEMSPLLIGISPTSFSMMWTEDFCRHVKKICNIPVVVGGNLATHLGRKMLEYCHDIDIVCIGDGEKIINGIMHNLINGNTDLKGVDNILYRGTDGTINQTEMKCKLCNLNEITWPKHHMLESGSARVITSRGCHNNCHFCTTPSFYNHEVRYRDMADVVAEMIFLTHKYGVKRFFFSDDNFIDNDQESFARALKFIEAIKIHLPNIEFRCEIRADVIFKNIELIKQLYNIGMKYLFVGYESCIESELVQYNKHIDPKIIYAVPGLLKEIGISVVPGFIMYNKDTSFRELQIKLDYLHQNNYLYRTTFLSRTCLGYPGSKYYNNMINLKSYDNKRSSKYMLYPDFKFYGIRALSVAFEEIEFNYLEPDSKMLSAIIYKYDDLLLRKSSERAVSILQLQRTKQEFAELQNVYYELFQKSISIALSEDEQKAIIQIVQLFEDNIKLIRGKVDEFIDSM